MKNIYTIPSGRIDSPHLILSLFFLVILITGPFSDGYFDVHPKNGGVKQYYENQTGSYSLFIAVYDTPTGKGMDSAERLSSDKTDQTRKEDTIFSIPPQKIIMNEVVW